MAPPAAAEKVIEPFPQPPPSGDPHADALNAFAQATHRLAAAVEAFKPAADTVHGIGARLDALCRWLRGQRPWIWIGAYLLLNRVVEKPEDLIEAAKAAAALMGGT